MSKKIITSILALATLSFSCSDSKEYLNSIKVAATPIPQAQMLEYIKPDLAKQGINLKIIVMDDYNLPNRALENGDVDANFFQHKPFLERQISQFHYHICSLANIHIEPMGIYSKKITSIKDLPHNAIVAIPNDPSNEARALLLLQKSGVISLNPEKKEDVTTLDVVYNPQKIKFQELDASMLTRALPDVTLAVIPTNFALEANMVPKSDALEMESIDSPYVNVIAVRCENLNNPNLIALKNAMTSEAMHNFISTKNKGELQPAFTVQPSTTDASPGN